MKKLFIIVLAGLVTWGVSAWISISNNSGWKTAGLIIGGLLAVAIIALLFKTIYKLVKWMLSSPLYLSLATGVVILLTCTKVFPILTGMIISFVSTLLLLIAVIRGIGRKAQTSVLWGSIFGWLIGYEYNTQSKTQKVVKDSKIKNDNPDANDVLKSLTGLGYGKQEAQEAMEYAIEEKSDASLEDKVKCALLYLGSNSVLKGIA